MAFPRVILLKSIRNNKYLRYRKEKDSNHAFLQFSQDEQEENAEMQYAKFEVQMSEIGQGFVHIRSCYNNKYWVRKSAESKQIAAVANEPEEDQTKWSCTLFKVDDVEGDAHVEEDSWVVPSKPQKVRLVHSDQMGQHACVVRSSSVDLVIGDEDSTRGGDDDDDVFLAYNVSMHFVFPDRFALIGHTKEYGAVTTVGGVNYLEFKTTDMGQRGVIHGLSQWPEMIQIQNRAFNLLYERVWTIREPLMVIGSQSTANAVSLVPLNLGSNQVALRTFSSPFRFANCAPSRALGIEHVLGFSATTMTQYTLLEVEEPVRFRQVSNMVYNLNDSRVYNVASIEKYRDDRSNDTSVAQTGSFGVEYRVSQTMTWADSVSLTSRIGASMSASIPFVGIELGVEISEERQQTVEWGNQTTEERTISYVQEVTIPPRKKIVMVVLATRAQCDVPFTCRVHDLVADGEIRDYTKTDGLFRGANEFNFITRLTEEDL